VVSTSASGHVGGGLIFTSFGFYLSAVLRERQ
jgi:hypothetical protein